MTKEEFMQKIKPYAELAGSRLQIDPALIASQWALETGYNIPSNNNLAGIYAYSGSPYGSSGKSYPNLLSFATDYANTLLNPRYQNALKIAQNTDNPVKFAEALKSAGYASDPNYEKSSVWKEAFNLYKKGSNIISDITSETQTLNEELQQPNSNSIFSNDGIINNIMNGIRYMGTNFVIAMIMIFATYELFKETPIIQIPKQLGKTAIKARKVIK